MVIAYKMFKHRDFRSLWRPAMKLESGPLGSFKRALRQIVVTLGPIAGGRGRPHRHRFVKHPDPGEKDKDGADREDDFIGRNAIAEDHQDAAPEKDKDQTNAA